MPFWWFLDSFNRSTAGCISKTVYAASGSTYKEFARVSVNNCDNSYLLIHKNMFLFVKVKLKQKHVTQTGINKVL